MRLTVTLPSESSTMDPDLLVATAIRAEELGYQGVWLPDHLLLPNGFDGDLGGVYEPLVTLSYLAAATTRITLGSAVIILPLRNPFVVAKQSAALAKLSKGRFILGISVGWNEQEYASVGVDFRRRGLLMDESPRLIRHLHTVGHGPFASAAFPFTTGIFAPIPVPPVPFMIGGVSEAALRRAATYGEMWQSFSVQPEEFREKVARLRSLTSRSIDVGTQVDWASASTSVDDVVAEIDTWRATGADNLSIWFGPLDGYSARMESLARRLHLPP
ncbi:MAG: TIGR03619 family F420-dependent LLM class oxidoreductase [Thermomicrobiales bacterium]